MKILLLGDANVGKTTILNKYDDPHLNKVTKPTIGSDFMKKEIKVDDTAVTLQLWDTAGQEQFQSLGYAFYRGADACALVFDITNRESFDHIDKWHQGFLDNAHPSDPKTFPILLVGNKADRESERKVSREEAE